MLAQTTRPASKPTAPPAKTPGLLATLKFDLSASVVVFLVALPLCMGVAIASGVPSDKAAAVGIISGIVGGIIVGSFSGCPLQVTGPAAGLAVIIGQLIAQHGFETLGLILIVAGVVQILAGVLGFGQWFRAVSPAVIHGMLAGIGVLIFASQFHVMVDDVPPGGGKEFGGVLNLYTIPIAVWKGLTDPVHRAAAILGVVTIMVIVAWGFLAPARLRFLSPPLVGVLVAMGVAAFFKKNVNYIAVPDNLADALNLPLSSAWSRLLDWPILIAGLTVAFVASAESLLTATACDAMQQRTPRTRYGNELFAQGLGNIVCGLIGAIPVSGVIVRTSANVQAGARSRLSTILHGVWLLIFACLFPFILRLIPVSSLAAILVYTGYKLVSPKTIKELWKYGKSEVLIYTATLATVVIVDLLAGILVGVLLAIAKLMHTFCKLKIAVHEDDGKTVLHLAGAATFLRLPKLANALERVPPSTELHVHLENLTYIDHACLELLMNWEKQHEATGGALVIDWELLTARFGKARLATEKSK